MSFNPNSLETNDMIGRRVVMAVKNNIVAARTCKRQYEKDFTNMGPTGPTGDTIRIRRPVYLNSIAGPVVTSNQAIIQRTDTLAAVNYRTVNVELTDKDMALSLNDVVESIMAPAGRRLGNDVDLAFYDAAKQVYNYVGTAGTAPSGISLTSNANAKLNSFGVPMEGRLGMLNPTDANTMRQGFTTYFNTENINKNILESAKAGRLSSFDLYEVQNIQSQTTASANIPNGTVTVAVTSVSGDTSIALAGLPAGATIYRGAVFQIGAVNATNILTTNKINYACNFVVAADTVASGGGTATIPLISQQTLIFDGSPYVNVSALPLLNAPVIFQPSHNMNIFYHPEAFTLAMIQLKTTNAGAFQKVYSDPDAGISIRMTQQLDGSTRYLNYYFDINFAVDCIAPEYAVRGMGATPF